MKTYDEMKDNVFRRIDEFEAEKKRKRKFYTRTAAAVCPLCAAGAAVFALWNGGAADNKGLTFGSPDGNGVKYAVTYASDITSESRTTETSAMSKSSEKASEAKTQANTAEKVNNEADIPVNENSTEEKNTEAPRTTEAERLTTAQNTVPVSQNNNNNDNNNTVFNHALEGDFVAWVEINGETYNQLPEYNGKADGFTKGSYVGTASQFEGYYTQGLGEDSDLYTVEGHEDWLILEYRYPASGRLILQRQGASAPAPQSAPTAQTAPEPASAMLWCIFCSTINYDGGVFWDSTVAPSAFTKDCYIGKISDFTGTYGDKVNYRINSNDSVYTVKESNDVLFVVKADSNSVYGSNIIMCRQGLNTEGYEQVALVPRLNYTNSPNAVWN